MLVMVTGAVSASAYDVVDVPHGGSIEAGNVWATQDDVDFGDLRIGGSAFLGAETPFGPLYLAAGFAEGDAALYLILGKTF